MLFLSGTDRRARAVPRAVWLLFFAALAAQLFLQAAEAPPSAHAAALPRAMPAAVVRIASLDEPLAAAQLLTLYLQAFDNQPGISIPFKDLDYRSVTSWLESSLALDPATQYPLFMAAHLYAQVPDPAKQRLMLDFVHGKFLEDPARRWRWLAHASLIAKHRLHDNRLALRYADDIARLVPHAPSWARQMRIFILEDMGEIESAAIMLGGLLATGEITDPSEARFLTERLEQMKKSAEKSPRTSKN